VPKVHRLISTLLSCVLDATLIEGTSTKCDYELRNITAQVLAKVNMSISMLISLWKYSFSVFFFFGVVSPQIFLSCVYLQALFIEKESPIPPQILKKVM
jgi:hypothetical protein